MAQLTKVGHSSALVLKFCSCLHFVAVAVARLEIKSHKKVSHCIVRKTMVQISDLKFVVMIIRLQVVRRLRNLLIAFLYPRAFNRLLYDATASM